MIALLAGVALAEEPAPPWEREVTGVELLVMQPILGRILYLQRRPDVRWPAPIEGAIGHVGLRLVDDGPVGEQLAVMMYAYMDVDGDGVNDPTNVWRGVFGGYDLRLVVAPLPEVARSYAVDGDRWIRRFLLPMTPEEIDTLMEVLREASAKSEAHELGTYRFFTENCATELTQLLDVALLGKDRELNYPYTLPRKYRHRGRITPAVPTVTPEETKTAFDAAWAAPLDAGTLCAAGDAACATAWVASAREAYGDDWVEELARLSRRRAYERRWPPELRQALQEAP